MIRDDTSITGRALEGDARSNEIWRALDTVLDPELDEPVTSLRFVTRVSVDGDAVAVDFRLPTYWCSPNFAWIMAEDMRDALAALPWTSAVTVTLAEHLFAAKINSAVNSGTGFGEAFADAHGDLTALRATFRRKAYLGRMATLVDSLRAAGRSDTELLAMRVGELRALSGENDVGPPALRYLELRAVFGGPCGADDAAFRTLEGEDIAPDALPSFLRGVRMARRGVEANGEMCRIYLRERTGLEPASSSKEGSDDLPRVPSDNSPRQGG